MRNRMAPHPSLPSLKVQMLAGDNTHHVLQQQLKAIDPSFTVGINADVPGSQTNAAFQPSLMPCRGKKPKKIGKYIWRISTSLCLSPSPFSGSKEKLQKQTRVHRPVVFAL